MTAAAAQYRLHLDQGRNHRGPDGQGWNRMAITPMDPTPRCALRPETTPAALDTLRGMAALGNITAYGACQQKEDCCTCAVATDKRDPWQSAWCIREDSHGNLWVLGNIEQGFACNGYAFKTWEKLLRSIAVPQLTRKQDSTGFYWVAAQ